MANNDAMDIQYGNANVSANEAIAVGETASFAAVAQDPSQNLVTGAKIFAKKVRDYGGDMDRAKAAYLIGDDEMKKVDDLAKQYEGTTWYDHLPTKVKNQLAESNRIKKLLSGPDIKDPYGNSISQFDASHANPGKNWYSMDQIRDFVKRTYKRAQTDETFCEAQVVQLAGQQQDEKDKYAKRLASIGNTIDKQVKQAKGDFTEVDPQLWEQLTYNQQKNIIENAKRYALDRGTTDPTVYSVILSDENMAKMSIDQLELYSARLSEKDRQVKVMQYLDIQRKLNNNERVQEAIQRETDAGRVVGNFGVTEAHVNKVFESIPSFAAMLKDDPIKAKMLVGQVQKTMSLYYQNIGDTTSAKDEMKFKQDLFAVCGGREFFTSANSLIRTSWEDLPNRVATTDAKGVVEQICMQRNGDQRKDKDIWKELMHETYYDLLVNKQAFVNMVGLNLDKEIVERLDKKNEERRNNKQPIREGRDYIIDYLNECLNPSDTTRRIGNGSRVPLSEIDTTIGGF